VIDKVHLLLLQLSLNPDLLRRILVSLFFKLQSSVMRAQLQRQIILLSPLDESLVRVQLAMGVEGISLVHFFRMGLR
jgi:hypothetical protein